MESRGFEGLMPSTPNMRNWSNVSIDLRSIATSLILLDWSDAALAWGYCRLFEDSRPSIPDSRNRSNASVVKTVMGSPVTDENVMAPFETRVSRCRLDLGSRPLIP